MILSFFFFVGLILDRSAVAQTNFRTLTEIDATLARLIPDTSGGYHAKIVHMLALRERECTKTPGTCLKFSQLSAKLCRSGPAAGGSSNVIWQSILKQVTNRESAQQVLSQLKKCSSEPNSGQLLGALELLTQLNSLGQLDLTLTALNWLRAHWRAPARITDVDLRLISDRLKILSTAQPLPMDTLKELSLISAQWPAKALHGIAAPHLKSWLNSLKGYLINTGHSQAFSQAVFSTPFEELGKNDVSWTLGITKALCIHWKATGAQRARCQSALVALEKRALGQPPLVREIEIQELKLELESVANEASKKKADALLLSVQEESLKGVLPWLHFDLAKLNLQLGHIDEAKAHLETYLKLTSTSPPSPPFLLAEKLLRIDILIASGELKLARTDAEAARLDLKKAVRGATNSLAWLDLSRLILAALENRPTDAKQIANDLRQEIGDLPDLKILNSCATAILRAMSGTSGAADLESAKKVLGVTNYEIVRIQSVLTRLAKHGS